MPIIKGCNKIQSRVLLGLFPDLGVCFEPEGSVFQTEIHFLSNCLSQSVSQEFILNF